MKNFGELSAEETALLNEIAASFNRSKWPFKLGMIRIDLIEKLGHSRNVAVIPRLAPYTRNRDPEVCRVTIGSIERILGSLPIADLPELDALMRWEYLRDYGDEAWFKLSAIDVEAFSADRTRVALASMHPDGYVREAAVEILAAEKDEWPIPFLLLRANDWVAPIARRVRKEIEARLCPEFSFELLRCLPIVSRLERSGRFESKWLIDGISELFSASDSVPLLREGLAASHREVRALCLKICSRLKTDDQKKLLLEAYATQSDGLTKTEIVRRLAVLLDANEFAELFSKLIQDPFMPVRREALHGRIQDAGADVREILRGALLDRHSSIRSFARFYLKNEMDFDAFYRDAILSLQGRVLAYAISGLGESGKTESAPCLAPFLDTEQAFLRKAAIAAIGRLDSASFRERLFQMLFDDSPGISRSAVVALKPAAHLLEAGRISLLMDDTRAYVRKSALRLTAFQGKWNRLVLFLRGCRDECETNSKLAQAGLSIWKQRYNYDFSVPQPEQISKARREAAWSREWLSKSTYRELKEIFKTWTK